MRHRNAGRKLGRNSSHRRALFRSLATALVTEGRIETTVEKAKTVRPIVEKLITLGRTDTLAARRRAAAFLQGNEAVKRLFDDVSPRFANRPGGYTRILHTRQRAGDAANMAILELVERG